MFGYTASPSYPNLASISPASLRTASISSSESEESEREFMFRTLEGFQGADFVRARVVVPFWRRGHLELFADMPRALYAVYQQADASAGVSALEELERTREALADSQIQLHELEEKLVFLERLIERTGALTRPPDA